MYLGSPAWMALLVLGAIVVANGDGGSTAVRSLLGYTLFGIVLVMTMAPKIATILDVLLDRRLRASFGGGPRFLAGVAVDTAFFFLISPIMCVQQTIFLIGLLFGRNIGWSRQSRDSAGIPWSVAAARLWLPTLLGIAVTAIALWKSPGDIGLVLLVTAGLILSIPFAVLTASPEIGELFVRIGLNATPEENAVPREIEPLHLPALKAAGPAPARQLA
jgi:membrane glycosyltransferase